MIQTVGIIGAGTMGNGIAQACAAAGLPVVMVDVAQAAVDAGRRRSVGSLDRLVKKEKMTAADRDAALARITARPTTRTSSLRSRHRGGDREPGAQAQDPQASRLCDAVAATLLASNTSSISITALAAATARPDRFIGMHFFNPVPMMALVELIRGLQTSDATHARRCVSPSASASRRSRRRTAPGFVVNRILCPMINEAIFALQEGLATAEDIDDGMKLGCNHPIGPLALADMIGLDVCSR